MLKYKKIGTDSKLFYPNVFCINQSKSINSRLAWCQGDIGISNALQNAGRYLKDDTYLIEAKEMILNSLTLNINKYGINDFGICHGSCGLLVQYFLFQNKNLELNFDTQIKQIYELIEIQTNDFKSFKSYNVTENIYFDENNLLEGATGLGLTILTINNKIDLSWLEIFHLH